MTERKECGFCSNGLCSKERDGKQMCWSCAKLWDIAQDAQRKKVEDLIKEMFYVPGNEFPVISVQRFMEFEKSLGGQNGNSLER